MRHPLALMLTLFFVWALLALAITPRTWYGDLQLGTFAIYWLTGCLSIAGIFYAVYG